MSEKSGRLSEERQGKEERLYRVLGEETADEEADGHVQQEREEVTDAEAIREHEALLRVVQCQFYE